MENPQDINKMVITYLCHVSFIKLIYIRYIGLEYGFGFTYTRVMTKRRVQIIVAGIWGYAISWGVAANIDWTGEGPPIVVTEGLECTQVNLLLKN